MLVYNASFTQLCSDDEFTAANNKLFVIISSFSWQKLNKHSLAYISMQMYLLCIIKNLLVISHFCFQKCRLHVGYVNSTFKNSFFLHFWRLQSLTNNFVQFRLFLFLIQICLIFQINTKTIKLGPCEVFRENYNNKIEASGRKIAFATVPAAVPTRLPFLVNCNGLLDRLAPTMVLAKSIRIIIKGR